MNKCAIFTITKNEDVFLPIWINYYKQHFNTADIYVLDNDTTDGSTDNLDVNVIKTPHDSAFDHQWLLNTVVSFQSELLKKYETVVFAETDEIICLAKGSLREFLNSFSGPLVRCNGYQVIHDVENEPDIDLSNKILLQRKYFYPSQNYSKTLISKIPINWSIGFHNFNAGGLSNGTVDPDPNIFLLHLHFMDYQVRRNKSFKNQKLNWSKNDLSSGAGSHNRETNEEVIKSWFNESGNVELKSKIEIPHDLKNVV